MDAHLTYPSPSVADGAMHVRELPWSEPVRAMRFLAHQPQLTLLDSAAEHETLGRHSYLACRRRPFAVSACPIHPALLSRRPAPTQMLDHFCRMAEAESGESTRGRASSSRRAD